MGLKYRIVLHEQVKKNDIPKLSLTDKERVKSGMQQKLVERPEVFGRPLRHSLKGYRKLRVGSYRVIFRIEKQKIVVFAIGHRLDVYKSLKRRL